MYKVAVVGATGAVGREMVKTLEGRDFPVGELYLFASKRSAGETVEFKGDPVKVVELKEENIPDGIEVALFSAGGSVSKEFAPVFASKGTVVIDNSSAFRMEEDVPLVVPEVNPHRIADYKNRGIISNPNCSTIQMVVAIKPIHDVARIKRIVVSTYQAVSGTGMKAIRELEDQVRAIFNMRPVECKVYPHQIAFNCLPHIDVFLDDFYTKEEHKMMFETCKIMEDWSIKVTATTVRVPVFYGHSESINLELEKRLTRDEAIEILSKAPGVEVADDPSNNLYPLAIDAAGRDEVFVGRIREDNTVEYGLNMWVVSDNIRKGAALNAVQIAELLVKEYL